MKAFGWRGVRAQRLIVLLSHSLRVYMIHAIPPCALTAAAHPGPPLFHALRARLSWSVARHQGAALLFGTITCYSTLTAPMLLNSFRVSHLGAASRCVHLLFVTIATAKIRIHDHRLRGRRVVLITHGYRHRSVQSIACPHLLTCPSSSPALREPLKMFISRCFTLVGTFSTTQHESHLPSQRSVAASESSRPCRVMYV